MVMANRGNDADALVHRKAQWTVAKNEVRTFSCCSWNLFFDDKTTGVAADNPVAGKAPS
jgi:hypothetical protein